MVQAITPKTNSQLERAKEYPIEDFFELHGSLFYAGHHSLKTNCIFHDDKNPSLVIYTKTNTFFCFGCQESGDSIKFYMKLHDCDFKTAIKELGR